MIDVEHLSKRFGSFTAVDDISFRAAPGEILGFLGPNGAGKTTTMRILTGFMPPTTGTARVAGYDVFTQSMDVRRRVGYLPETVPLYPDMSVRGYVDYVAALRHVPRRRERVDAVLDQVGMADRADSLIRSISKGMRQRVGLAQALVHAPDVLILDEPTIGLDPRQVTDVRRLVRDLGQTHTVLFSTHILTEAEQVCDRVLIIHEGRIVAQGAPDSLRDLPGGGAAVFLRLAESPTVARVRDALASVNGVADVRAEGGGLVITFAPGAEARGAVTSAVVAAGWEIVELRPYAADLESVFLALTE